MFPFLCRMSSDSRRVLEAGARLLPASRGQNLIRKGDVLDGVYLVVQGRVRVHTLSADGDEATLYTIEAGETCPLALNSLLARRRTPAHQAWVSVQSASARLFWIPSASFRDLYEREPVVREFALDVLSSRIADLMVAIEELSLQPVSERIVRHLRRHADARGEVRTTHAEIARALGTAREVVTRRLRDLRRTGRVGGGRGGLRVTTGERAR